MHFTMTTVPIKDITQPTVPQNFEYNPNDLSHLITQSADKSFPLHGCDTSKLVYSQLNNTSLSAKTNFDTDVPHEYKLIRRHDDELRHQREHDMTATNVNDNAGADVYKQEIKDMLKNISLFHSAHVKGLYSNSIIRGVKDTIRRYPDCNTIIISIFHGKVEYLSDVQRKEESREDMNDTMKDRANVERIACTVHINKMIVNFINTHLDRYVADIARDFALDNTTQILTREWQQKYPELTLDLLADIFERLQTHVNSLQADDQDAYEDVQELFASMVDQCKNVLVRVDNTRLIQF